MNPETLKKIRENYGLSMAAMSKVLGFGINQWRLYEEGQEPKKNHALLINMVKDPNSMLKLLRGSEVQLKSDDGLGEKKYLKTVARCEELLAQYQARASEEYKTWVEGLYV
jgi:transcriptional regulator with XRE-family HTH domain